MDISRNVKFIKFYSEVMIKNQTKLNLGLNNCAFRNSKKAGLSTENFKKSRVNSEAFTGCSLCLSLLSER